MAEDPSLIDVLCHLVWWAARICVPLAIAAWQHKHRDPKPTCTCCDHPCEGTQTSKGDKSEQG